MFIKIAFIIFTLWAIRESLIALDSGSPMNVVGIIIIIGVLIWVMKSVLFQGIS